MLRDDVVDRRYGSFLAAPAARALLWLIQDAHLPISALASPSQSFRLVSQALNMVDPFEARLDEILHRVNDVGENGRSLAIALLQSTELAWWWDGIDRARQMWSSLEASPRLADKDFDRRDRDDISRHELYAHKPLPLCVTSTASGAHESSFLVSTWQGTRDLFSRKAIHRSLVSIDPCARVFEITGPQSWHELVLRYPTALPANHTFAGDREELVPNWPDVAHDWDGVHISLGALLMSDQVWVTSDRGSTCLQGWGAESTHWLRWRFDSVTPIGDAPAQDPTLFLRSS